MFGERRGVRYSAGAGFPWRPGGVARAAEPQSVWDRMAEAIPGFAYVWVGIHGRRMTTRAQAATVIDGLGMKDFVVVDFEGVDFVGEVFAHAIFVDHMYRYTYRPAAINARPEVAVVIRRMERLAELRRYSDAQS